MEKANSGAGPTKRLESALCFDAPALAVNRRGGLTPGQHARLSAQLGVHRGWSKLSLWLTLALLVIPLGLSLLIDGDARRSLLRDLADQGVALRLAIFMIAFALLVGGATFFSFRRSSSASALALRYVTGELSRRVEQDPEWGARFQLRIAGAKFLVAEEVYQAFDDGAHYALYYVEHWPTQVVVSAERLR